MPKITFFPDIFSLLPVCSLMINPPQIFHQNKNILFNRGCKRQDTFINKKYPEYFIVKRYWS